MSDIDRLVAFLDELQNAGAMAAPAVAQAIGSTAAGQYAAGAGPDGPWPPNRDGSTPLRSLTERVTFRAQGAAVVASAPDELEYHVAPDRGRPARPWRPVGDGVPGSWATAADGAIESEISGRAREVG